MHCCLQPTCLFHPVAFGTLGPVKADGAEFLSQRGCRISPVSGDQREIKFLFQHLSICVQRHNGTFPDGCVIWNEARFLGEHYLLLLLYIIYYYIYYIIFVPEGLFLLRVKIIIIAFA